MAEKKNSSESLEASDQKFPSFRGTAMEIIRLAGDPDCPHSRLVDIVKRDPTLSIKILRFANSALLRLESEVTTVSRAVTVIGVRALRNMAICFAACDAAGDTDLGDFDLAGFFEDSIRRAVACEIMSSKLNIQNADEAFTVGLLQDFGVVALAMKYPDLAGQWNIVRRDPADHRREHEIAIFGESHDEISAEFAKHAGLPKTLSLVMENHHKPERSADGVEVDLVQLASWAEAVADVFVVDNKQPAIELLFQRLKNENGMGEDETKEMLSAVPALVEEYGEVLGLHIPAQSDFDELLRETNRQLAEMNMSYQELTWKLEAVLQEKAGVERELRLANVRLERLAGLDPLTEIPNRRSFEKGFLREIDEAIRKETPLSVLIVDIDHFKNVNDTYGHPFGDITIRAVANGLHNNLRTMDMVARIGGEEFAVFLPGTNQEAALMVAERLRACIENLVLSCGTRKVGVTISIGGSTLAKPVKETSPEALMKKMLAAADERLLEAKRGGRNRVQWVDMIV
jgi:two-component system cell cycle response regulator